MRIAYGERVDGALHVPVRGLGSGAHVEEWPLPDGVTFGSIAIDDADSLEDATRDAYARLIAGVRDAGFPYFLRIWNYVGGINAHDAGRERYQLFCAGRHDAFVDAGYHHDVDLPAASAVGMPGRGLVTYYVAAREPGVQVENPRQVAAYDYPPQYGPKSPSFSRATVWNDTVFVSGTSSVVGHATLHAGDAMAQLDETLRNIEAVLAQTGRSLANGIAAKTYIRHARDYDAIARRLDGVFASNLFLEADICRADLLLEIEAIAR
ncbi:MAG TPA: Rid family hydrolase [Thermoanaerobaculia bacterium]|nr:Rid family hydrolase [Thermoanaerobaculia bacterium]